MQVKKLSGGVRFLLGLLSFVLSVVLFVSALASMLVANAQLILTKDNMKSIVSSLMFNMDAPTLPVRPTPWAAGVHTGRMEEAIPGMGDIDMGALGSGDTSMITELIYGMLQDQFGEEVPLTYEAVESFVEESTLSEFVSEKVAGIVSDIVTGEVTTTITGDEIAELIEENAELIKETFDYEVTPEMVQGVSQWVEENEVLSSVTEMVEKTLGPVKGGNTYDDEDIITNASNALQGVMDGDIGAVLALVRIFTSQEMLLSCIGVCAVLIVLLLVINIKQIHTGLKWIGVPLMVAGFFSSTPVLATYAAPSLFVGPLAVAITVLQMTAPVVLGVFVAGLVLLVVGCVLTGNFKKKLRAAAIAAAQAPVEEPAPVVVVTPVEEPAPQQAAEEAVAEEVPAEETTAEV